ncbi:MAG: phosphatase PAP2 family protein [Clostridiales bacterium]|nr:phosphatase PAP2 family protein [Clostridiales bacterium]
MFLSLDLAAFDFIGKHLSSPFMDAVMTQVTVLGNGGLVWLVLTAVLLSGRETRRNGLVCVLALFLVAVLGDLFLKNVFMRERPFIQMPGLELLIASPSGYSFPSGHAASSFAAATVLALNGRRFAVIGFSLAFLIAFSRVYLSVHFLTDVLGGIFLGIACGTAAIFLFEKVSKVYTAKFAGSKMPKNQV